jgi:hypothetical protein
MRRRSGINIEFGSRYPNTISVEEWTNRCRENARQRARALAIRSQLSHDEFVERMNILREVRGCLLNMKPNQVSIIAALRLLAIRRPIIGSLPRVIGIIFISFFNYFQIKSNYFTTVYSSFILFYFLVNDNLVFSFSKLHLPRYK